jgi:hypothetical protein
MRALLIALLCLFSALPVAAAEKNRESFEATYAMYTGGFDVVEIDGFFKRTGTNYEMEMLAFTKGLLGSLAPWKGELVSKGKVTKKGGYTPAHHRFSSWWRSKEERTTFTYDANGTFKSMELIEDDGKKSEGPVDPELTSGTRDMLTALAVMLDHYKKNGNCSVSVPSFDGKRKFNMVFKDNGDAEIKPGRYSIFSGKARTCTIEIVPVAGLWREKARGWMSIQDQGKKGKKLPKLWIAKAADDLPVIPVRFDVFTQYGNIVMHLTGVK